MLDDYGGTGKQWSLGVRVTMEVTLKNIAQNIAEKPTTNLGYAFIRRRVDNGGEAVELGRRGMEVP